MSVPAWLVSTMSSSTHTKALALRKWRDAAMSIATLCQ